MQTAVQQCNSWIAERLCPSQWKKTELVQRIRSPFAHTKLYKVQGTIAPNSYIHSAGLHSAMYLSTKCGGRCPSLVHSAFKTKSAKCKLCRPVPTWSRLVAPTSAAPGLGVELVQLLSSAVQNALCIMLAWTGGLQLLHSA